MPPILAIGAFAALGFAAFSLFRKAADERDRELAFRAASGWSLEEVAGELTGAFDADRDGRLAFDVVRGARLLGESVRVASETFKASPGMLGLILPAGTQLVRERRTTWSIEPLLRRADVDGDGIATRAEIAQVLRAFDADGNGRLNRGERANAIAAHREVRVSTEERTVGVIQPPPKPVSPGPR